jgi:hypothetical protein
MIEQNPEPRRDFPQPLNEGSIEPTAKADGTIDLAAGESTKVAEAAGVCQLSATTPSLDRVYHGRKQRISELRTKAFSEKDPLVACLDCANSDLFDVEVDLAEQIKCDSENGDVEQVAQKLDLLLRVVKQISQITQVAQRQRKDSEQPTVSRQEPIAKAKKTQICAPTAKHAQSDPGGSKYGEMTYTF